MFSLFLKERHHYEEEEKLKACFFPDTASEEEQDNEWEDLKAFLINKKVIKPPRTDLGSGSVNDEDEDPVERGSYTINYVGIIIYNNRVIKCFPKYFNAEPESIDEDKTFYDKFKQVIKVIKKYKKYQKDMQTYGDDRRAKTEEYLSIIIRLLDDYFENGCYENDRVIRKLNGQGEIDWNKTVNSIYPYISDDRPIYFDYYSKYRESNTSDYLNRLHKCILTRCSAVLDEYELTDLLDLSTVELSEEDLDSFGDKNYILERINSERSIQFNSRKLEMLDLMETFLTEEADRNSENKVKMFGTDTFQYVWEDVCKKVFDDDLDNPVDQKYIDAIRAAMPDAPAENSVSGRIDELKTYKDIMERPRWYRDGAFARSDPLKPDCIKFAGDSIIIYDAKYYHPVFVKNDEKGSPDGSTASITYAPKIGDITKQYLYLLGYKEFAELSGIKSINNYFLMPIDSEDTEDWGYVEMSMFKALIDMLGSKGENKIKADNRIEVKMLSARKMYDAYLAGAKNGPEIMKKSNSDSL